MEDKISTITRPNLKECQKWFSILRNPAKIKRLSLAETMRLQEIRSKFVRSGLISDPDKVFCKSITEK